MLSALTNLFRGRSKKLRTRRGPQRRVRPSLEPLEKRELFTAGITFTDSTGSLYIVGSNGADVATVTLDHHSILTMADDEVVVTLTSYRATQIKSYNRYWPSPYGLSDRVRSLHFTGLQGADQFTNQTSVPAIADGGADNDILTGGSGNDVLK